MCFALGYRFPISKSLYNLALVLLCLMLHLTGVEQTIAQNFSITDVQADTLTGVTVDHESAAPFYYLLERSEDLQGEFSTRVDAELGVGGVSPLADSQNLGLNEELFYRILRVPISNPLDSDGDGMTDTFELYRAPLLDPLNPDDDLQDPNPNDPGEKSLVLPESRSTCQSVPVLTSLAKKWVNGVYLFSGEFYQLEADLVVRGRVMDFAWTRKYRSQTGPTTAMGNRWDFSYNIFLERQGENINLHNGMARMDTYQKQADGSWSRHEFFRRIVQNPGNTYTLSFPDTGQWNFFALDGAPNEGKIESIVDRNGNTMSFQYDGGGRLVMVIDDLQRPYDINYTGDMITSVCDFTGRCWTYAFYQDGDNGGSAGDLKSVTTPPVNGTPNGNDFPAGKTTTYTYSKGHADERLNHNLLTVTDPKGQTYLLNEYAATTDENDLDFGRVLGQTWGDPGDRIDLTYIGIAPTGSNNFAVIKTILNDREGHVKEFYYDENNYGLMFREFTGLAGPDMKTTENTNRPAGKLRPGDPEFFETRWAYNTQGLASEVIFPNLNSTLLTYDETNLNPRLRGNLLEKRRLPGPLGGDQAEIVETYEYVNEFGGCGCGPQFVARYTDGRGNITTNFYDGSGNRTQTIHRLPTIIEDWEYNAFGQAISHTLPDNGSGHRRRDEFTYHLAGAQKGYLHQSIIDSPGFSLTIARQYNSVGIPTKITDPRGHDLDLAVNSLDQVVRRISREVTDGSGIRYESDVFRDFNDNVVRIDAQNIDDAGVLQSNTHYITLHEFDILNNRTRTCREVGEYTGTIPGPAHLPSCIGLPEDDFLTTHYEYNANRNQTLYRYGEATEGRQTNNVVQTRYDERDLVLQRIRAPGTPQQSTIQFDYDGNKNQIARLEGLESTPHMTASMFDGFNRKITRADPMGNLTSYTFDANGNSVSMQVDGELQDVPGTAGNVRLSESTHVHDAMDRIVQRADQFFDTKTQTPILEGQTPDGLSVTTVTWSDTSQAIVLTNDNLHAVTIEYDSANRPSQVVDELTNSVALFYDLNSNLTNVLETERSETGLQVEVYTTQRRYDAIDRLTHTVDNVGSTNRFFFDSRNNLVLQVDALGNAIRTRVDGINRIVERILDMDQDGPDGNGPDISTAITWDDSNRIISQTDDNGNATGKDYDSLNREIRKRFADGTQYDYAWDVHDTPIDFTDANGTVVTYTHDLNDRVTRRNVAPGVGVSTQAVLEIYSYDGLSRTTRAEDDDSLVTFCYDSLSHVIEESLQINPGGPSATSGTVTSVFDGVGNKLRCVYPGGRTVSSQYDVLERKSLISDLSGTIADYEYLGPKRVRQRELGNGTRCEFSYDGILPNPADDFGERRVVRSTHSVIASGQLIDDRSYTWDRMGNKLSRNNLLPATPNHLYDYDDAYRLTTVTRLPANATTKFEYDGVGNRTNVVGGANPGSYLLNATLPIPADFQMNQYSVTPIDRRLYDLNGSMTVQDNALPTQRNVQYDFRNQMVQHEEVSTGDLSEYQYDPFGRRTLKLVIQAGMTNETRFFYDGFQVVEEQDAAGTAEATFVYGRGIDEVLTMNRDGNTYYFHGDDLGNIMAASDDTGAVAERYDYGPFGAPNIFDGAGVPIAASNIGNPYLFTGRRFDPDTGWYYYRTRYMDPSIGRFLSRDIIGIWGDPGNFGNGTTYVGNNPWSHLDPFGLYPSCYFDCMEECKGPLFRGSIIVAGNWARSIVGIARCPEFGNALIEGARYLVNVRESEEVYDKCEEACMNCDEPGFVNSRYGRKYMNELGAGFFEPPCSGYVVAWGWVKQGVSDAWGWAEENVAAVWDTAWGWLGNLADLFDNDSSGGGGRGSSLDCVCCPTFAARACQGDQIVREVRIDEDLASTCIQEYQRSCDSGMQECCTPGDNLGIPEFQGAR
jgi:RHS repeat-associated protein